jgi:hypothetical protein
MMRSAFLIDEANPSALRALNYTPATEAFRKGARRGVSQALGEMTSSIGPAYGAVFTRIDCQPEHGVELLSQTDMFAAEPEGRVIRRDSMPVPEDHCIRKSQVLIAAAGTLGETELYGRSVIADGRLEGKYVGPHAMVLTFKEPGGVLNLYVYAVLCTNAGVGCVRSASYGTKVLGVRPDLLASLPIPLPKDGVVERVATIVKNVAEERRRYLASVRAARAVVESLPEMREALLMCADRKAQCVLWKGRLPTLSAWNFASTGGALSYLQSKWSGRLKDIVPSSDIFLGDRFPRILCSNPFGVDFLTQRDVFLVRPIPRRIVRPNSDDHRLLIASNTLLTAGRGTVGEGEIFGRVSLPCASLIGKAVTGDLLRIIPEPKHIGRVYAFLSTKVGLRLLRSTAVGTKILAMRGDLLSELPIPDLSDRQVQEINGHIRSALEARDAADYAEAEATRIVESEVLPKWLS